MCPGLPRFPENRNVTRSRGRPGTEAIIYITACTCIIIIHILAGRGVLTQSYKFAENDSISCQNITILRSELNPFGDTVFHLSIQTLAEPLLQVGLVSSAEITVVGKPEPTVEVKPEPTQGGEEPDKGSGKDGEDNTEEEGTKEGAKEDGESVSVCVHPE